MDEYETYDKGGLLRDRYLKVSDISEGSYGLVSVAKDTTKNNKLVAVKFIYPMDYKKGITPSENDSKSGTKRTKTSILRGLNDEAEKEIRFQKILGAHSNVASLLDNFDSCLVLEYCSRGDLYEAIHSGHGPSTSQDIKDVFHQILNALEFCHSQGVYHRDLKPENILIAEDWSIKFCDWGLATTTKVITNRDEFDIGSERYMAPELFDATIESYDASKIDIWSVGIILLTLVFHKNPFQVANYSDKRFLQFVNNREALFDVFSTMTGEMFSILRYCLNIDPTNRDLASLSRELSVLKYFTIDEEYWGSDYEEEDEEEAERGGDLDDFEFEHDDFFAKEQVTLSPHHITEETLVADSVVKSAIDVEEKNSASSSSPTTESSSFNSKSQFSKVSTYSDDATIPHNHRADALLSSNTDLKPIPIGGSGVKFVRNTRKPFNVASYQTNKPGNNHFGSYNGYNNHNTKQFIREDFFTPKSVFNHYMDKYGEQRDTQRPNNGAYQPPKNGTWNRHGRKPRTWKKNTGYNFNNRTSQKPRTKGAANRNSQTFDQSTSYSEAHSGSVNANRRKSRSYSMSKLRKNPITVLGPTLLHPNGSASSNLSSHSNPGTNGKYIPPYLRSPTYAKSGLPLSEEFDNLTLNNDYDEVFQLEGDFDEPKNASEIVFKKPSFRAMNNVSPENIDPGAPNSYSSKAYGGYRQYLKRPTSMGGFTVNNDESSHPPHTPLMLDSLSASASGKYVPPFRRGSAAAGCPPDSGSKHKEKDRKIGSTDFRSIEVPAGTGTKACYPLAHLNKFAASSVPVDTVSDWSYKKEWIEYD